MTRNKTTQSSLATLAEFIRIGLIETPDDLKAYRPAKQKSKQEPERDDYRAFNKSIYYGAPIWQLNRMVQRKTKP